MTQPVVDAAADPSVCLRVENVSRTFDAGRVLALDHASLRVGVGRFVALIGPSGSGKSTLLHVMAGLLRPSTGDVWFGSARLRDLDDAGLSDLRLTKMGFVFQFFSLVPNLTVLENIELGATVARVPAKRRRDKTASLMALVGLSDRASHLANELSGGEQQRVALARALWFDPAVLLADEPTAQLDTANATHLLQSVRDACTSLRQTVVLATHDLRMAAYADEVVLLRDGAVAGVLEFDQSEVPAYGGEERARHLLAWMETFGS